jgi:hypothetical protein
VEHGAVIAYTVKAGGIFELDVFGEMVDKTKLSQGRDFCSFHSWLFLQMQSYVFTPNILRSLP